MKSSAATLSNVNGAAPKKSPKKKGNTSSSYRYLRPFLRSQKRFFSITFVCVCGFAITQALVPPLAKQASTYIGRGDVEKTAFWLGLAFLDFAIQSAFLYGQRVSATHASLNVVLAIRKKVYENLHRQSIDYFANSQTGDLTYRLTEDIDRLGEVILG